MSKIPKHIVISLIHMAQFICEKCKQKFTRKESLDYHTSNESCKDKSFTCKICQNKFSSKSSMYRHMRASCLVKKSNDAKNEAILARLVQIEEENKLLITNVKQLRTDNEKLKTTVEKLSNDDKKMRVVKKNTNNIGTMNKNTNNGTVINATINLVGYGNEDLSKLNKAEILKALQTGYNSTVKLTEAVHFNPNFPEFHNVYISNMKDKYAMMHDGKQWTLTTKEDLISKIYEDKKSYIEENLEEFVESLHPSRKRALARWLDTDDDDKKVKEIKENIKLLLYNSKNMIIDTKGITKSKSIKVLKNSNDAFFVEVDEDIKDSSQFSDLFEFSSNEVIKKPSNKTSVKKGKYN
jgi:hypothetical protein